MRRRHLAQGLGAGDGRGAQALGARNCRGLQAFGPGLFGLGRLDCGTQCFVVRDAGRA